MKKLLAFAAIAEAATGIALIFAPLLVGRLLLGAEFSNVAIIAGRVAGIALMALSVACWPDETTTRPLCGMSAYSVLATLYLFYVAIGGETVGPLLWPAVVVHAILSLLLARIWFKRQEKGQL